jgi:hypothetical protein
MGKWDKWGVINLSTHMEKTNEDYKRDSELFQVPGKLISTSTFTQTSRETDRTQTVLG